MNKNAFILINISENPFQFISIHSRFLEVYALLCPRTHSARCGVRLNPYN